MQPKALRGALRSKVTVSLGTCAPTARWSDQGFQTGAKAEKAMGKKLRYAHMEVVVNFFRVNSKKMTSKFWFSHGSISKILV